MGALQPNQRVVAEGTYVYDGAVECDVRVVYGPIGYGCGPFDQESEQYDDMERDTYYVDFGSTTERGVFTAGGGAYATLAEALEGAKKATGIGPTIRWHRVEA